MKHLVSMLAALLTALAAAGAGAQGETRIVVLHTNDLHGHIEPWQGWEGELAGRSVGGFARLAGAVKRERARAPHVLLLDAGDTWSDAAAAAETRGAAVLELMNAVGYDAMVIGNHEPDFGVERLRELAAQARFPLLGANLRHAASGEAFARPHLLRELGGVRVGILGIAYPNTPLTTAPKNTAGLEFGDAVPAARRAVEELRRAGAQLVIALTHLGLGADEALARAVPGIDVIVGGHSHNRMQTPARVAGTLIVQAGAHGSDLGRLELVLQEGRISEAQFRLVTLNESVAPDPEVAARVQRIVARTPSEAAPARAAQWLVRAQTLAGTAPEKRAAESPVDSLFADLLREAAGADVALLPGVGYGVAIPPGPIHPATLRNLVPHDSKVVTMTLTGTELRSVLEQSLENVYGEDPFAKVGGMVQISGMLMSYDLKAPAHQRLVSVEVGEAPLDAQRRYRVVTNSLLAAGGHRYKALARGEERSELGSQYAMLAEGLARAPASPPAPGRIRALQ